MRPSEQAPCAVCGAPERRNNSNKCKPCYNEAKRKAWANGAPKTWEICRSRRARDIRAHVATDIKGDPMPDTIMSCYFVRGRRKAIMAVTSRQAKEWARENLGVDKSEVVEDVCALHEIDYNLTPIDLKRYGWNKQQQLAEQL
jgi:hypothetical protein